MRTKQMKHLGTKRIETNRLILRPFIISDAEHMWNNWVTDPDVTEFLMWPPHENIDVTIKVLTDWVNDYVKDSFYQWAIVPKTLDEPIGSISIVQQRDDIKMVHVGYCIGKKWWNQGYTSEALNALIKFFFSEVGVKRIESRHDPRNPNSGKVMSKCGMKYEGLMRQADYNNKGICDYVMYGLIADDYK